MQKIIEASGICKKFGETQALKDISFEVNEGEIFGFIGPDGAGKTTLFRIIATLLIPDEGKWKSWDLIRFRIQGIEKEHRLYARDDSVFTRTCRLRKT